MATFDQEFTTPETTHGPIKNKGGSLSVRVRHDAEIRVTTTYCDGRPTDTQKMTIDNLEGYLLTLGALYNVSGYYNPHRPKVSYRFVNKRKAFLKEGEFCTCAKCKLLP